MAHVDFITKVHQSTPRDYVKRVVEHDKAEVAEVACRFGREYWDGERHEGYGGYRYDGRWRSVAEAMARHYGLEPGARILDVGCGDAVLAVALAKRGAIVTGVDADPRMLAAGRPRAETSGGPSMPSGTARGGSSGCAAFWAAARPAAKKPRKQAPDFRN